MDYVESISLNMSAARVAIADASQRRRPADTPGTRADRLPALDGGFLARLSPLCVGQLPEKGCCRYAARVSSAPRRRSRARFAQRAQRAVRPPGASRLRRCQKGLPRPENVLLRSRSLPRGAARAPEAVLFPPRRVPAPPREPASPLRAPPSPGKIPMSPEKCSTSPARSRRSPRGPTLRSRGALLPRRAARCTSRAGGRRRAGRDARSRAGGRRRVGRDARSRAGRRASRNGRRGSRDGRRGSRDGRGRRLASCRVPGFHRDWGRGRAATCITAQSTRTSHRD